MAASPAPAPPGPERPPADRRGFLRRTIVSLILVGVVLGVGLAGFRTFASRFVAPPRAPGGAPLPVVRVEALERGPFVETLRGYGTARVLREARVMAEVAGVVRAVAPDLRIGAAVRAPSTRGNGGPDAVEPLVVLDARDLEDAIARLEAARRQVEADLVRNETDVESLDRQLEVAARRLATSKAELERIRALVERETLPESELDRQRLAVFALEQMESELRARRGQAVAQRAVLDARLESSAVELRQARRDLGRTRIYAPFDGAVRARHVEVGSRVAPGTPLFDLLDRSRVEVGVALPAGQYGTVEEGSEIRLRLQPDGPIVWSGEVARVDPAIDAEARTFRVWAEVPGQAVAPGAPVIADVLGRHHPDVLAVPREAFLADGVYVAESAGVGDEAIARRRRPKVEVLLPGVALVAAADETLADGDLVVVSNLEDLADGSRIRTVRSSTDASSP